MLHNQCINYDQAYSTTGFSVWNKATMFYRKYVEYTFCVYTLLQYNMYWATVIFIIYFVFNYTYGIRKSAIILSLKTKYSCQ